MEALVPLQRELCAEELWEAEAEAEAHHVRWPSAQRLLLLLGDLEQVGICSLHYSVLIYKRLYITVSWS